MDVGHPGANPFFKITQRPFTVYKIFIFFCSLFICFGSILGNLSPEAD